MDNNATQPNTTDTQVDPTALALWRSIKKAEGGSYDNYSGDASTSAGVGQWNNGKIPLKKGEIPMNFRSMAQEVGLDSHDFSEANQDHVGYSQAAKALNDGLTQSQFAARWNSGLTKGWEHHVGDTVINGQTVHYDTPAYVAKVQKEYSNQMKQMKDGQPDNSGYTTTANMPTGTEDQAPAVDNKPKGFMQNLSEGHYGDAAMSAINNITSPFAGIAAIPVQAGVKAYNAITGSHVADPYSTTGGNTSGLGVTPLTAGDKTSDLLKAGATTATVATAGGLMGALKTGSAIASPAMKSLVSSARMSMPEFNALTASEKYNFITEALNSEKIAPAAKQIFKKALQEVIPAMEKEQGVAPGLLQKALTLVKGKVVKGATGMLGLEGLHSLYSSLKK